MTQTARPLVHIVAWRLNGTTPAQRASQADLVVQAFEAARDVVPGLLGMRVGRNLIEAPDAWDIALYMEFASHADLQAYQAHPSHLAIKQLVGPMRSARAQVDFELIA